MKKILFTLTLMLMAITAQAQFKMGDVNRDGEVNILDATTVVDLILYGYKPFSLSQTDVAITLGNRQVDIVENGDFEEYGNTCFYSKEDVNGTFNLLTIKDNIGVNGSRAVMVKSKANPENAYDTNFAIRFLTPLSAGTQFHIEFDYKASIPCNCTTTAQGEPGNYHHYNCLGGFDFTTQWKHYSNNITVNNSMAGSDGMRSIVFNLAVNAEATQFYFDNIKVTVKKPTNNLITNSDMEGDDTSCFVSKDNPSTDFHPSVIYDGVGVNSSRAIMVSSEDNPANAWDSQFHIRLPEALTTGEWFNIEFDYKASTECQVSTQAHGEPGYYQHWNCIGSPQFTTQWQHFKKGVIVTNQMAGSNGMRSIAFMLSNNQTATQFYFDNIKVEVVRGADEPVNNATVEIIGGYDDYYVMTDDPEVVVPSVSGHTITFTPVNEGIATVTVVDNPTYRALEITVMVEE